MEMPDNRGRFKRGEHWRSRKPFWDRDWLVVEYIEKERSASDIGAEFGVRDTAIHFWLKKHKIKTRSTSEARRVKKWGLCGAANGMYGKCGILNPNWRGGHTPLRQEIYAKSEWASFSRSVRKRDKVCRLCESDEKTEIHHIDPFSQAPLLVMDIGNVILLCQRCHRKMRGKEKQWKRMLFQLLEKERR